MPQPFNENELSPLKYRNSNEEKILYLLTKSLFERDGTADHYPRIFPNFGKVTDIEGKF